MFNKKDYKIVLIGQKKEFLVLSTQAEMERRGYDIELVEPLVSSINQAYENAKICVLFVDIADSLRGVLNFLKDNAFEKKFEICIVGEKLEVKDALKYIGEFNVGNCFERPVNSREISDGLEQLYEKAIQRNERKSILIIDDEPEYLRRTQQILHNHYKIYVANSGASALMLLAKHKVSLILLDYLMPVADGFQVLKMLKKEPETSSIPVIFLSGIEDERAAAQMAKYGAEAYIYKGMAAKTLVTTISDYFAKKDYIHYKGDIPKEELAIPSSNGESLDISEPVNMTDLWANI